MKKGSIHSEETRKRMSLAHSGEKHHMYGKHHSEEARRKICLARAKQVITQESNNKRSETQKGRIFSKGSKEKMKQHAFKRFSDKRNHPNFGKPRSQETKDKISNLFKGIPFDERYGREYSKQIRTKIKKAREKQIFPIKDSSIEIKIQNFLKELKIEFFTHQRINIKHSYQCDILIPSMNLVIECDGMYWHKYPTGKEIDHIRTKELISKGFKVLRLWEFEIKNMKLNKFKEKLI